MLKSFFMEKKTNTNQKDNFKKNDAIENLKSETQFEALKQNDNFITTVEPFLNYDLQVTEYNSAPVQHLKDYYRNKVHILVKDLGLNDKIDVLSDLISNLMLDIHLLKTAYVEKVRYKEPNFKPYVHVKENKTLNELIVDFRGEITGSGWWHAEVDGRWAGPESESTVLMPNIGVGKYRLEILVVDEIDNDIISNLKITFNKEIVNFERKGNNLPCLLVANVEVKETYRLPFLVLKFHFHKLVAPIERGVPDTRKLAIRVQSVKFLREE